MGVCVVCVCVCVCVQAEEVLKAVLAHVPGHRLELCTDFGPCPPHLVHAVHPPAYTEAVHAHVQGHVWQGALRGAGAACYAIDMVRPRPLSLTTW